MVQCRVRCVVIFPLTTLGEREREKLFIYFMVGRRYGSTRVVRERVPIKNEYYCVIYVCMHNTFTHTPEPEASCSSSSRSDSWVGGTDL